MALPNPTPAGKGPDGSASAESVLAGYLQDAADRFARVVLDPPGSSENSKTFRRARATALLGQIDRIARDAKVAISRSVTPELAGAYRQGIDAGLRDGLALARSQGVAVSADAARGGFASVDADALQAVARDTVQDLTRAVDATADRASKILRRTADVGVSNADLNKVIARGLIAGTPLEAMRDLREQLRGLHGRTLVVIDKNGDPMNFDVGHYARLVVRTRTREAVQVGRHTRLSRLGLDLVRVVGRLSNNFCSAYLFKVYSLSGNHPKYPALRDLPSGGPPFHPNCTKSTAPFVEALASDEQRAVAEPDADSRLFSGGDTAKLQRLYQDTQMRAQATQRFKDLRVPVAVAKNGED